MRTNKTLKMQTINSFNYLRVVYMQITVSYGIILINILLVVAN